MNAKSQSVTNQYLLKPVCSVGNVDDQFDNRGRDVVEGDSGELLKVLKHWIFETEQHAMHRVLLSISVDQVCIRLNTGEIMRG